MLLTKKTLLLNIVSTESKIFSGDVNLVIVSAEQGEMGIYPGHAPLLTKIKPGLIRFVIGEKEESFYVSGGYVEVQPEVVIVLANTIIRSEQIDLEKVEQKRKELEELMANQDVAEKIKLQENLNKELAKIKAYEFASNSIKNKAFKK